MTDPRTTSWRWLANRLQNMPELRRRVDNWFIWEQSPRSDIELPQPQTDGKYNVRLTPVFEPETPMASQGGRVIYQSPVMVRIEVRAFGPGLDGQIDLWGAFERAVDPVADIDAARAQGISWWEWVQPSVSPGDNTTATGGVRLVVMVTR